MLVPACNKAPTLSSTRSFVKYRFDEPSVKWSVVLKSVICDWVIESDAWCCVTFPTGTTLFGIEPDAKLLAFKSVKVAPLPPVAIAPIPAGVGGVYVNSLLLLLYANAPLPVGVPSAATVKSFANKNSPPGYRQLYILLNPFSWFVKFLNPNASVTKSYLLLESLKSSIPLFS